jgi:hypothetical protein
MQVAAFSVSDRPDQQLSSLARRVGGDPKGYAAPARAASLPTAAARLTRWRPDRGDVERSLPDRREHQMPQAFVSCELDG